MTHPDPSSPLTGMTDDQLGTAAVALVISEIKWSPDVAPAVLDRISRDAVTYPEQFDRRPVSAPPTISVPQTGRSASRTMGRLLVFAMLALLVVVLILVASNATASVARGAEAAPTSQSFEPAPATQSVEPTSPLPSASAQSTLSPESATIRIEPVADGFVAPRYVSDDGLTRTCLYVVERGGVVKVVIDGRVRAKPFLDISDKVSSGAEQGLHSIAFHPNFQKDRRVYVDYNDLDGNTRIAEYTAKPCESVTDKKPRTILTVEQPRINNNAGWIGFGPDGYLYIPLGDGGGVSPGDPDGYGQDKATLLSKVLRVDVDQGKRYAIPKTNPFARQRQGYPREAWAMGLRDPRLASFDRATGDLWIGDLGEDSYEEVDRIPAGESALNFGWSDMEGTSCHNLSDCDPANYTLPTYSYDSIAPQCGIVGGYVYRGTAIPELVGTYLFGDICSGSVWGIDADAVARGEPAEARVLLETTQEFVSFGEDDAGELYLVAAGGTVYRIEAQRSDEVTTVQGQPG